MKTCSFLPALFALALGALGCGEGTSPCPPPPGIIGAYSVFVKDGDVYVAGVTDTDRSYHNCYATLWKNGAVHFQAKPQHYPSTCAPESAAFSVFVSGADVYLAGMQARVGQNRRNDGTLWINGSTRRLDDTLEVNEVCAGYVSVTPKGDVYVLGTARSTYLDDKEPTTIIWKNGEPQYFPHGINNVVVGSLFVSGEDVYALGSKQNLDGTRTAMLCVNGTWQEINLGFSCVSSLFVSGKDVYIAGLDGDDREGLVALWVNNEKQVLGTERCFSWVQPSVFVSGGDVYVLGAEGSKRGYWKNGKWHIMADSSNIRLSSIFVSDGNVYVAGKFDGRPMLWKNGKMQTLPAE